MAKRPIKTVKPEPPEAFDDVTIESEGDGFLNEDPEKRDIAGRTCFVCRFPASSRDDLARHVREEHPDHIDVALTTKTDRAGERELAVAPTVIGIRLTSDVVDRVAKAAFDAVHVADQVDAETAVEVYIKLRKAVETELEDVLNTQWG